MRSLITLFLINLAWPVLATDLYVAPTGADTNTGS